MKKTTLILLLSSIFILPTFAHADDKVKMDYSLDNPCTEVQDEDDEWDEWD